MTTETLTDFLLARIAEDEAWLAPPTARRMIGRKMVEVPIDRVPEYARRDHDRWSAECEAKRRIVAEAAGLTEEVYNASSGDAILSHLATIYADHPDYREEWRA